MSTVYHISHPGKTVSGHIRLDGSKSISNRILIIEALSGHKFDLSGLSGSHDTETLKRMLEEDHGVMDAGHAGTSFRFSTAFAAVRGMQVIITGSERMKQRPVGPLADALKYLGAAVDYLENPGYPPLRIGPSDLSTWKKAVRIPADVSSQYISALMMIAPVLPNGLIIQLEGEIISRPYIEMTAKLMARFGVPVSWHEQSIHIPPGKYQPGSMAIEADWSAASYYYAIAACAEEAEIRLEGLSRQSLQGDQRIADVLELMGVHSAFEGETLVITKSGQPNRQPLEIDFSDSPDIAQTVAVIAAACRIPVIFSGLQTLVIKETDRIMALDSELKKINCRFESLQEDQHLARPNQRYTVSGSPAWPVTPTFETYEDHRMAMAFAPLAMCHPIQVRDPGVVQKSYPGYWADLEKLGFTIIEEA